MYTAWTCSIPLLHPSVSIRARRSFLMGPASVCQRVGEAKAAALEAEGRAEASVLDNKAEAWERFGEAALVQVRRPMYQPVCVFARAYALRPGLLYASRL